eukprot:CAMPEP_0182576688 /NCGR_PEP_ID=MMETSP1324-20130603/34739_1 /TAXON_ID=236786 /ORGANISM="Florenciella sp., Strain RCC1587" /LENGTH=158 /DNA_ID=CAMNT_0024792419 /DNA_START=14 /DNA_END=486 /DNA_ORIENTATION=-
MSAGGGMSSMNSKVVRPRVASVPRRNIQDRAISINPGLPVIPGTPDGSTRPGFGFVPVPSTPTSPLASPARLLDELQADESSEGPKAEGSNDTAREEPRAAAEGGREEPRAEESSDTAFEEPKTAGNSEEPLEEPQVAGGAGEALEEPRVAEGTDETA